MTASYVAILKYYGTADDEILKQLAQICERRKCPKKKAECKAFMDKYAKDIIKYIGQKVSIKDTCQDKIHACGKPSYEIY
jgi:hypothetical protein